MPPRARLASLLAVASLLLVAGCPGSPAGPSDAETTIGVKQARKGTPAPAKTPGTGATPTPSPKATDTPGAGGTPTPGPTGTGGASPSPSGSPKASPAASPTASPAGTPKPGDPPVTVPVRNQVSISKNQFQPSQVTVKLGGNVSFNNDDLVPHTVKPDGHTAWAETASMPPGGAAVLQMTKAGTFKYVCGFHGSMKGTIVVVE